MDPQTPRKKSSGRFSLRSWATPLTIGSFFLMTVTGILMFFDVVPGYITFAHEWFSWFFVVGSGAHIAVNFRPFKNQLGSKRGRFYAGAFSAVLIVSFFSWGRITGPQLKWPLMHALVDAPISALAHLKRLDPADLIGKLERHGIKAEPGQSLAEVAKKHDADEIHLLGILFLPEENHP